MGYNYGRKTFIDRYFYWLLFVPIVALALFTSAKLHHDFRTIPMSNNLGGEANWVDHSSESSKDWGYYAMDGHKLGAVASHDDDIRAYLFCVNQEGLEDHDFDSIENAKRFVEKVCDVNEIERDGIPWKGE